jgi:hypothetical protein
MNEGIIAQLNTNEAIQTARDMYKEINGGEPLHQGISHDASYVLLRNGTSVICTSRLDGRDSVFEITPLNAAMQEGVRIGPFFPPYRIPTECSVDESFHNDFRTFDYEINARRIA